jgi:hypothetical protein
MFSYRVDSDHRDDNEGSIILSLISQLKYASSCCADNALTSNWLHKELGWTYLELLSLRSSWSLEVCLRGLQTSCRTQISSLGKLISLIVWKQSIYFFSRAEHCNDPEERFIRVLQYYLAGWHIKPKGVKKP